MTESRVADTFRRFAEREARGQSLIYDHWALGVAEDHEVLTLIDGLPTGKRQPNLVFAAARFAGAPETDYAGFREWVRAHWHLVRAETLQRTTQTNEAARCAVLLPVLSRLDGPLALIEVGAAAGLCLYPDRYSYRYEADDQTIELHPPAGPSTVSIRCRIDRNSVPPRMPEVGWRRGVDLRPIAVADPDGRAWLRALVWPEHEERRRRLDAALSIAAASPSPVVEGDLVDAVSGLIESVPAGLQVVVFHSSVLVYVDADRRERFAELMRSARGVTWISNEGEHVLNRVAARLTRPADGRTVLAVDEVPVALVGPHGQSYESLA